MLGPHVDRQVLERFAALDLAGDDLRRAAWHLSLCGRCRRSLGKVAPEGLEILHRLTRGAPVADTGGEPDYAGAFAAAKGRAVTRARYLEEERRAAPELAAELIRVPRRRRRARIAADPRFCSLPLADCLLAEARRLWNDDNRRAEELAHLALAVADGLGDLWPPADRALLNDVRAEAWATIGTARRLASDLRGADEAFAAAGGCLRRGSAEPLILASVLLQLSSLRRAQRRFEEADRVLNRVVALYRRAGDAHLEGKTLLGRALLQSYRGDAAAAIPTLERAARLIDARREPRLLLVAKHNLAHFLVSAGRAAEALRLLPDVRELTRRHGKRLDRLVFDWLEGTVDAELGHHAEAEAKLRAARDAFVAEGIGYNAALISLELAALYLQEGRSEEVERLAAEMLPIFESRDVHREAAAALVLFQKAVAAETATTGMVRDLAAYLRKARDNPKLRYERPS